MHNNKKKSNRLPQTANTTRNNKSHQRINSFSYQWITKPRTLFYLNEPPGKSIQNFYERRQSKLPHITRRNPLNAGLNERRNKLERSCHKSKLSTICKIAQYCI